MSPATSRAGSVGDGDCLDHPNTLLANDSGSDNFADTLSLTDPLPMSSIVPTLPLKDSVDTMETDGRINQTNDSRLGQPSYLRDRPQRRLEAVQQQAAAATAVVNQNQDNAGNGVRPWIVLLLFSVIQMLFSSATLQPNGVNASSSNSASNSRNDRNSGTNNGGSSGANQQYFHQLPVIRDPSKAPGKIVTEPMTESRRLSLRQTAKDMFFHGYDGYLNHAFPLDELNPVACKGRGPDKKNPKNINLNDVLGDYSLTLIDALDTLAVMREPERFSQAIELAKRYVGRFNIDSRIQVFEVNIRVLGALLSGHLYASDPRFKATVKGYKNELLDMAEDLGKRLLRAFENTPTGIPWPRVNLKKGVLKDELSETCVAGAGSLVLEFGVLSRLTGDMTYETAARRAVSELWKRRSKIGLLGNSINITSGEWLSAMTGIGAGTDSFYEYLLKSYVLFGDEEFLQMYETAQESIRRNLLHDSKYFYKHVHLLNGDLMAHWVDSLSAFMPGVQVLGGDIESAIKNHLFYYNIWRKYQAIPERFNFITQTVEIPNYPLRPEFIESNYLLYRATKDPFYLQVGEMILGDLQKYTKTKCGWASLQSVIDKEHEDRMESFALSETFKYLFLLFDEENLLHNELKDSNYVFTTEGHVLSLSNEHLGKTLSKTKSPFSFRIPGQDYIFQSVQKWTKNKWTEGIPSTRTKTWPQCAPYEPPKTFLKSIPYRPDADFARQLVGVSEDIRDRLELDPNGYCEKPTLSAERLVVQFVGPSKKTVFDERDLDRATSNDGQERVDEYLDKDAIVIPVDKGVYLSRIVNVKFQLQYDADNDGYRVVKVDDFPLSLQCNVFVERSSMFPLWDSYQRIQDAHLRVYKPAPLALNSNPVEEVDIFAKPADFGSWRPRVLNYDQTPPTSSLLRSDPNNKVGSASGKASDHPQEEAIDPNSTGTSFPPSAPAQRSVKTRRLVRIEKNKQGCRPFTPAQSLQIRDKLLVVDRGECLFILKAYYAQAAGAYGVIVINSHDNPFAMSGVESSTESRRTRSSKEGRIGDGLQDDAIDIHVVMVGRAEGDVLLKWIHEEEEETSSSSPSASSPTAGNAEAPEQEKFGLAAAFVQRKVEKEVLEGSRLSYNNRPVINILTLPSTSASFK